MKLEAQCQLGCNPTTLATLYKVWPFLLSINHGYVHDKIMKTENKSLHKKLRICQLKKTENKKLNKASATVTCMTNIFLNNFKKNK